ncbi:MAG: polyribonucleotide nucleotidyltransferase [Armatimonadota bacterium]
MIETISFEVGGKELSIETGRVAKQANGAVLLGMGETVVLGTATMSTQPREGLDFVPLTCDYEERKYAVGKIPGGFIKRGGRPSEKAILTCRLIDRPVRPLFPDGMRNDVQCIAMPFAMSQEDPSDVLAINAVSAALALSDIPWGGPIAAVRVGMEGDEFVLFPSVQQTLDGKLDLVLAGTKDSILMVEAGASEVPESVILEAMRFGQGFIRIIAEQIEAFAKKHGKPKATVPLAQIDPEVMETVTKEYAARIEETLVNPDKQAREDALQALTDEAFEKLSTTTFAGAEEKQKDVLLAMDKLIKKTVRSLIVHKELRPDGRGTRDIRAISCDPGLLPKVHGSGMFTRGQTQVMTVVTLGAPGDSQIIDGLEEVPDKRYMHYYNFPPYSVGETRPMRGPGRREIGHGALAERALLSVLPDEEEFPYTMLLVSEVLESNGSTSMASVCGSTLALLDCGVPLKAPVAGIAMGLISEDDKYSVLTDIQGMEDFCGDMDFKVAGTREGVTALQLDTKIGGIPDQVLEAALEQAREARMFILDRIEEAFPEPRRELNPNAPRINVVTIDPTRAGELIGPGGRTVKRIQHETGAEIDIQDDGRVFILATNAATAELAVRTVKGLMATPEVGEEYDGVVTRLFGRGAMVEYLPGKEGMVPNEQLSPRNVRHPEEVVKPGDAIRVRIHEIDAMGRVNLTALGLAQTLEALGDNESAEPAAPRPRSSRPRDGRGDRRGGPRGRGRDGGDRDRESRGPRRREYNDRPPRQEAREPELAPREGASLPQRDAPDTPSARFRPKR